MLSEIRVATVGVGDLAGSREFSGGVFEYFEHGCGSVRRPGFETPWQLPPLMTGAALDFFSHL